MSTTEHECPYCGTTEGLRINQDGRAYGQGLDVICGDCFTGQDDGPCFDDLPALDVAPAYDREAHQLFGLTVSFVSPDKRWCVTGNGVGEMVCGDYEAAVEAREAVILRYLPAMDQITIDSFLRADRIVNIRSEIIDATGDGIERHEGHVSSLYVFESGGFWGEAYDDELLALERLLESAKAAPANLLCAVIEARNDAPYGVAAE